MYSYFSDLHVDLLAQALLQPGERRLAQSVGRYMPWWALGFVNETYLVIATDQRLILIEHRMAWLHQAVKMHSVESIPWSAVQETRLKGIFGKKLVVRGQGQTRAFARTLRVPAPLFGLLAPIRNNVAGARAVASAFDATRSLGAAPAYAALPPQGDWTSQPPAFAQAPASAQPQMFAPPQPVAYEQTQPHTPYPQSQPAALPAFNSPGYASVPPAPSQVPQAHAGIAPLPPRVPQSVRPPQR
jgi:hypothetical protein